MISWAPRKCASHRLQPIWHRGLENRACNDEVGARSPRPRWRPSDSCTRLSDRLIRYSLGQHKAYGNANHGLRVLKGAQGPDGFKSTRGRLHALAAAVLDGAGFAGEAAARVAYALKYQPQDPEIVRMAFRP